MNHSYIVQVIIKKNGKNVQNVKLKLGFLSLLNEY